MAGFDETTLRCGDAGEKKYVLSASAETATFYHLGGRDLDSFAKAGILPAFAGVAVHDHYRNYFQKRWENLAGNPSLHSPFAAWLRRRRRDLPEAHWPAQPQRALRGLIKAWHL